MCFCSGKWQTRKFQVLVPPGRHQTHSKWAKLEELWIESLPQPTGHPFKKKATTFRFEILWCPTCSAAHLVFVCRRLQPCSQFSLLKWREQRRRVWNILTWLGAVWRTSSVPPNLDLSRKSSGWLLGRLQGEHVEQESTRETHCRPSKAQGS